MQDVARLPSVRVHIGRGQDTCISEQARRTRRTPTAGGVDSVRTVDAARTRVERGFGAGGSCGRRRMTSRALG